MPVLYVGIDVSAKTLNVATNRPRLKPRVFDNSSAGRGALRRWLEARSDEVKVVLEPTGLYSLDVALQLTGLDGIDVTMPNPRAVRSFAKATMTRRKDDPNDAALLVAFALQMPFRVWTAPTENLLQARALSRAVIALGKDKATVRQRLHAATRTSTVPDILVIEFKAAIKDIEARQKRLRTAALALITMTEEHAGKYASVRSLPGVADGNAITLTTELAILPDDMTAKQWTAHSGLDPVQEQSGTSLLRRPRISRRGNARLRQCLYLASLTAVASSPDVKRVHQRLVDRGKTSNQAHCAIMRKYLHVIHAMWKSGAEWDGSRFGA